MSWFRNVLTVLAAGSLFSIITLLAVWYMIGVRSWYRMTYTPSHAEGTIIKKDPENRQQVTYTFAVGGGEYSGQGGVGDDFERIKPGDKVQVFYDPEYPNTSTLPGPAVENFKVMIFATTLFSVLLDFPSGIMLSGWIPLLHKRRSSRRSKR
jgi:hypothetical protein